MTVHSADTVSMALRPFDMQTLLDCGIVVDAPEICRSSLSRNFVRINFLPFFELASVFDDGQLHQLQNSATMASKGLQGFSKGARALRALRSSQDPLTVCVVPQFYCASANFSAMSCTTTLEVNGYRNLVTIEFGSAI